MRFLVRFYPLVIVLGIGLAVISFPRVGYLFKNLSTDPIDLLPNNYQSVINLKDIRDKFEKRKRFGIVFESENPENTKRLLADLKPILEKLSLVNRVYVRKPGFEFFDQYKFLYIDLEDLKEVRDQMDRKIQQEKFGGFYIDFEEDDDSDQISYEELEEKYRDRYGDNQSAGHYVSPNGRVFALYAEAAIPNMNIGQEKKFQDQISEVVKSFDYQSYDPTMKLYFGGSTRVMEYRALLRDLKTAGIISGFIIFLPLLIRFRRPQYVLLIFIPLIIGVPAGMALASIWVPRLNVTTSFLFAILGGLGVETGIHVFSRYYEKRREGLSLEAALMDMYLFLGPPVFTAVAALATTFLLMIISDFRGFSEFGFISGVGLWTVFLLYFTFFPALLIFAEKIRLLRFGKSLKEYEGELSLTPSFVRTCLVLFCLFTVFSVAVTPRVQFEYNSKKIRADDPRDRLAKMKQRMTTGKRVNNPAMVLVKNEAEAQAIKKAVGEIRDNNPNTVLDYSSSFYSLVPSEQEEKLVVLGEIDELLTDDALRLIREDKEEDLKEFRAEVQRAKVFGLAEVPKDIQKVFLGKPGVKESLFLIFAKPHLELDHGKNAMVFREEIREIKTRHGSFFPSSSAIVYADVLSTMFRDSKKILIMAFLCILFFVFLDFRNWRKSAMVMFSILAGVFWTIGVLYLLRIKLNLYNMVMIPAVMGMSVDNSIHVYHRYEELGRGSLSKVLSTTGIAAMLASLTNAAGFVGLAFTTHGGLRSMGVLAVIGVACSVITTLVFMPMTLQFFEWRKYRNVSESPQPSEI